MVGACVIIVNNENEILLQLRQDNNCLGLAGGAVEIGEYRPAVWLYLKR